MHRDRCRVVLSTVLAYILHVSEGCGRDPARTKLTPTTASPTAGDPDHAHTTPKPSHVMTCTPDDERRAACIHGNGHCFAMDLLGHRQAHCRCNEMWTGTRCERLDGDFFVVNADKVTRAGIAAGVVVVVIVLTVVIVYLVIKRRKKRRKRARGQVISTNGGHKQLMDKQGNVLEFPAECGVYPDKSETNV